MKRVAIVLIACGLGLFMGGCVPFPHEGVPPRRSGENQEIQAGGAGGVSGGGKGTVRTKPHAASPSQVASVRFVRLAERDLQAGHVDTAISLLERAITLDGYNGQAYYDLALSWRRKGDLKRALAFSKKAELFLREDVQALKKVYRFEASLYREMGQPEKAAEYHDKAARLP